MQSELLKNVNEIVISINNCIASISALEQTKEKDFDRLCEYRNQLKQSFNIDSTITFKDGILTIEIHNP